LGFPYTYSDKINFSDNRFNLNDLKNLITKELLRKHHFLPSENNKSELLKANSPFLKIPFSLEFKMYSSEIKYKVHLDQLIKIILIVIIFSALFSYTSLSFFFWFASLFSVLFYFLNILIINSYVQSSFTKILENNNLFISEKETLSEEQKIWLNDKNRCPACGFFLSDIDLICPECGLHLKRNRHTIPLNISKYQNKSIKYHYKKK